MAEILRKDGYVIVVWPDDHEPPHLHVFKAGSEMKIAIGRPGETLPSVLDNKTMVRHERKEALRLVIANQAACLAVWERVHG